VSEYQNFDVAITAYQFFSSDSVSDHELHLIRAIFPEILKEMMQYIEQDEE
jgi:hypothetical protein